MANKSTKTTLDQILKNPIISFARKNLRVSGLLGGLVAFCFALTPSLLPRPTLYMGAIAGISAAIGYGLGVLVAFLLQKVFERSFSDRFRNDAWIASLVLIPITTITMSILGSRWQNEVRTLVGEPTLKGNDIIIIALTTLLFFSLCLLIGRSIRYSYYFTRRRVTYKLPRWIGVTLSLLIVFVLGTLILKDVAYDSFVRIANKTYSAKNQSTPNGVSQPDSSLRSGGPESLVSWDTIGYQGKSFVAGGPDRTTVTQWTGQSAEEQIRVYVGLDSKPTPEERADLALAELKRTGAFDRKYLIVATPTGTGWVEPQSADTVDYLTNGDSAIAAIQYSYLPSWISFIVDKENARDAGKTLYDTVFDYWNTLPENNRPQIIAYGLSLGSFGGQAAFSGQSDMITRTQGALFMGTPNDTQPWRTFTNDRDSGSREILPIYDEGQHMRFAATKEEILADQESWHDTRILYMQHGSDPVVWYSPDLFASQPAWLKEPRAYDVSPMTRWVPIVTFLQVAVDQFFGTSTPNGHGHNYSNTTVYAFDAILRDTPWSDKQIEALAKTINEYSND